MKDIARLLLILLLILCSNVFLISQIAALKAEDGRNLLSIRDLVLGCFCLLSLPFVARLKKDTWSRPVFSATSALVVWSVPLAIWGMVNDNPPREVFAEVNVVIGWCSGICAYSILRARRDVLAVVNTISLLAVGIAIGVLAEIVFRTPIVTGSAGKDSILSGAGLMRSTPTCWPMMNAGMAMLLARSVCDDELAKAKRALCLLAVGLIFVASMLTLSRTIVVGFLVSAATIALVQRRRRVLITFAATLVIAAGILVSSRMGTGYMGWQFQDVLKDRYAVLSEEEKFEHYARTERRPADIRAFISGAGAWLLHGSALGTPLWQVNPHIDMSVQGSDVAFVQFGTRYGVWGLLFLGTLGWAAFRGARQSRQSVHAQWWIRLALSSALTGVWTAGQISNIWFLAYTAPLAMVLFFASECEGALSGNITVKCFRVAAGSHFRWSGALTRRAPTWRRARLSCPATRTLSSAKRLGCDSG